MESTQKNILTVLLIIIIVIIVGIIGYLGFELINQNVKEKEANKITDEFDSIVPTVTEEELLEGNIEEQVNNSVNGEGQAIETENGGGTSSNSGTVTGGGSTAVRRNSTGSSSSGTRVSSGNIYISGNWVAGTITIPATGIKYSIFAEESKKALEKGVCMLYTMEGLNHPGNTVIVGHNYRNRLFFSRNKNLKIGDKIIIKDCTGLEITYIIFNKFTANKDDASFYQRETNGKKEITLSTCTDQGTKTGERLIICAREA